MQFYSKVVVDMNKPLPEGRFEVVSVECYEYDGPVDLLCGGPTAAQQQLQTAQSNYYNTMTQEAESVFGQDQALYSYLTSTFEPIINAGPNQQGFSQEELNTLNSSAITTTGQNYANAAKAVNEQIAAEGGGNTFIPSGANNQLKEEVATSAAALTSQEESQILQAGYQQGYNEYEAAVAGLEGGANVLSGSAALSNSANNAGSAASQTANEIAQEDNSWMGAIGGLLGAGLQGWATGGFKT